MLMLVPLLHCRSRLNDSRAAKQARAGAVPLCCCLQCRAPPVTPPVTPRVTAA
jgi:hypothetical protein